MDQLEIEDILSGRRGGVAVRLLRFILLLLSWVYSLVVRLRRAMYRAGWRTGDRCGVPVVSVGNLTTGGTGKTPMVAWIAQRYQQLAAHPGILTRGYKSHAGKSDEGELLGKLAGCPVVVDADRILGAYHAIDQGADVLIMDDGFQHLRLHRDLDVVLIDAINPFGFGHCLPRGYLREPPWALKYADVIVITRCDAVEDNELQELYRRLERLAPSATLHAAVHKPIEIVTDSNKHLPLDALCGRKIFAFCGIANPGSFFQLLQCLGARIIAQRSFDDHIAYTPEILTALRDTAQRSDADVLVTTQKDFVKLTDADLGKEIWELAVQIQIVEGQDDLAEQLRLIIQ